MAITLTVARKQWQEENKKLIKTVKATMAVADLNQNDYAERLGMTGRTLRNRLQNPEEFRQYEIQSIRYLADVYGIQTI